MQTLKGKDKVLYRVHKIHLSGNQVRTCYGALFYLCYYLKLKIIKLSREDKKFIFGMRMDIFNQQKFNVFFDCGSVTLNFTIPGLKCFLHLLTLSAELDDVHCDGENAERILDLKEYLEKFLSLPIKANLQLIVFNK